MGTITDIIMLWIDVLRTNVVSFETFLQIKTLQ